MRLAERALGISPSPTLSIDAKAKQMKAAGIKVISFGVGEPDFDTPDHIKEAAVAAIQAGETRYTPAGGTLKLKQAIVDKFRRENGLEYQTNQIVVSVGAKHSLYNAFQVLCQPGDEVILPAPYWVSYLEQIKLAGAQAVIVQTREANGFKLTPRELKAAITDKTRVFLLNSPSNPTGAVYSRDELAALGEVLLEHNITVISDEIYEKLLYDGLEHVSIASLSPQLKENTVVINGVSKAYAMTGWRIGYAAAPAPVAKAMADLQSHATSNPTSIAQAASVEALNGSQAEVAAMVVEFAKRRDYMLERVKALPGVSCPKPGGAFYLYPNVSAYFGKSYQGKTVNSATDLADLLLEVAEVAVVPGIAFGGDDFIRLSYATSMENIKEGMDRIEKLLRQLQ
ncbi:pyridoxal phosphate-dependent aminotransferase [Desulforamulus hydrothermalis]|uniref:Aminotransferase n=1 Tax=Desulforamulus hydrothermalis Lam5 = DSM 18033 TaxID=1121428 RepID=K8DXB7_9FIRM|nr:pyridoxal phosphate-dependent aminotransferase [Desulforamulus hydrothermalis]CCO07194.1 Aspartate aminotransferase [Desulforamulus hydrothermalis Lam5 = DSM 18033]SHG88096.1 aspartate aminotransferase [Desulforamulus hydrothermalis Lam5 = DSM 18033]